MLACQRDDGHWVFELEADATIPGRIYPAQALSRRARRRRHGGRRSRPICARSQGEHGGWPLFQDGAFDMSATVKAYFALKMIGDDPTPRTCAAPARRCWRAAAR